MPDGQGLFEGFWGHITEFIKRMKIVLAVFVVALFVMLILPGSSDFFATTDNYKPLMSVLLVSVAGMFLPAGVQLFAGSMSDPITLYAYAAVVFAVGFALPVFAYEAYKFIDPALYPHERKSIFPFVFAATALFVCGGLFGFFFLAPSFIQGFIPFYDALNAVKLFPIMDFYGIVFFTILVSGVIFTIPAFFVILVKFGVLHTSTVRKQRKYVYAGLAITAMLISPGATPLGNLYLFLALFILVELSVFVGKRYEHKLGRGDSQSLLSKWISPTKACKFCNSQLQENAQYCPECKRYLM
jgi:sec-independent protein translocase protein TatC